MVFNTKKELLDFASKYMDSKKIFIWGADIYGSLIGKLFVDNNIEWYGYYDNFVEQGKSLLNNKLIYSGKDMVRSENTIYILSLRNYNGVKKQLVDNGIKEENIVWFEDIDFFNELNNEVKYLKEYSLKIKKLYNIHNGEKCFVIGNGPSLNLQDLEKINKSNIKTFASNYIFKCFDKTDWRPDYYFFIDGTGIRETFEDKHMAKFVFENCRKIFIRNNSNLSFTFDNKGSSEVFPMNYIFSNTEENIDFSDDCSEQVYIGYTVTYAMLQFAVYMGFKEIYLLGMDHSFSKEITEDGSIKEDNSVKNHSDILDNYKIWNAANLIKNTLAYEAAQNYADKMGIKIYNATRGGKLEVFKRVNFDSLL